MGCSRRRSISSKVTAIRHSVGVLGEQEFVNAIMTATLNISSTSTPWKGFIKHLLYSFLAILDNVSLFYRRRGWGMDLLGPE